MSAPRVAPGGRTEVGVVNWAFAQVSGRVTGTSAPNVFLVLGRAKGLFRGWLHFAGRMMPGGKLPRRETELVILRVAHLAGCDYEFQHHVHLGRRAGVTAADVERVVEGPAAEGWSPRERALLAAAEELVTTNDLGDEAWADLRAHLDEPKAIELVLLATHYRMLATTIIALRVPPDRPRPR